MIINCAQPLFATFVFDVGGVLLNTDTAAAKKILSGDLMRDWFAHWSPTRMKQIANRQFLYNYLHARRSAQTGLEPQNKLVCDDKKQLMPDDLCDWLNGTLEIEQLVEKINKQPAPKGFNDTDKKLVCVILEKTMLPESMLAIMQPAKGILKLLQECQRIIDPSTGKPHELWLLSNHNKRNLELLRTKFPEIFSLFTRVFVSGELGMSKPHPAIYQQVLNAHREKFGNQSIVLIDDQPENTRAGRKNGLDCITHSTLANTQRELQLRKMLNNDAKEKEDNINETATKK